LNDSSDPRLAAPRSVYIHIPFCTNKCYYCDFNSYVRQGQPVMDYLRALEREMAETVRLMPPDAIDTIFVGGGTPTVLTAEEMGMFLAAVKRFFPFDRDAVEFTMEANPGTTDEEKLAVMREFGVNRISFGAQSFDDGLLKAIGRIHSPDDVRRSLELARKAGFDNLSVDLMFGLPNQTMRHLESSIAEALAHDLAHCSIYGLKVEENTLFFEWEKQGLLPLPDQEEEAEMYRLVIDRFRAVGYRHYEISNFARPGRESRHNLTYWRNEPYYGLGAGAHGYAGGMRHVNVKGVSAYIAAARAGLPRTETIPVSREEAMEDFMMVGLRLIDGVKEEDFRKQFGVGMMDVFSDPLTRLTASGLLVRTAEGFRLSDKGLLLGNEVFAEFVGILV
jgi:oxygen-independent coproporphyrinogen-3 oxidase